MSWEKFEKNVTSGPFAAARSALFLVLVFFFIICVPVFFLSGGGAWLKARFYEPQIESARRVAFEETRSYNIGNREELRRLKKEYDLATEEEKEALSQYILAQFSEMDWDTLPSDLKFFLESL